MTKRTTVTMFNAQQGYQQFLAVWVMAKAMLIAGHRMVLSLAPETRTQAQNRLMWPLLTCFAKQLQWPINGKMTTIDADDFKDILSAAFKGETMRLAMGLNGGVVLLGQRTSKFTKPQFAEWIEFLYATASDRGVVLPAWNHETGEVMT